MNEDKELYLTNKIVNRHFKLQDALTKFHNLFIYNDGDDRAIVIIGGSFLDILLEHILLAFLPEDDKEIVQLFQHNHPLGIYGNKVRMAYCLGLIDRTIKDDLKLIGKIRNHFAHDLYASFDDPNIESWCKSLQWHRISMMREPPDDATTRDFYQVGVNQLIMNLHGMVTLSSIGKKKNKR